MSRLFITLFVLIGACIALFVFTVNTYTETVIAKPIAKYQHSVVRGITSLLDEQIIGLDGSQRTQKIQELNTFFGYPIDLAARVDANFSSTQAELVDLGLAATVEIDGADHLYSASIDPDYLWVISFDDKHQQRGYRQAIGPFELVQRKLANKNAQQRLAIMDSLQPSFGFPISIFTAQKSNIKFTADESERLASGEIVVHDFEQDNEKFFMKVRGTDDILTAGPIADPLLMKLMPFLVIAFLALLLAATLWFWMRPLWRDLRGVQHAALQISKGELSTRIAQPRTSLIGSVISGFNHMAEHTEHMIASQKELTNAVSHELRTPVARMKFGLELLETSNTEADRSRHIKDMRVDVNELDSLLGELLTFARYEHGVPAHDLQETQLKSWLLDHIARAKRQDNNCIIDFHLNGIDDTESANFEPQLMGRALSNGLQNALRHARGRIVVNLHRQQDEYVLQIDDDGDGIPLDMRDRVFSPFVRVDESRNRDSGGFGLGLPIAAQAARWHGGSAEALDSPLGGLRLQIRWPVKIKAAA